MMMMRMIKQQKKNLINAKCCPKSHGKVEKKTETIVVIHRARYSPHIQSEMMI